MGMPSKAPVKKATRGREVGMTYLQQEDGSTKRIPFTDATGDMTLQCKPIDIKEAKCGDPMNCVMARMFRRSFGPMCVEVRVGKTAMHVVSKTPSGELYAVRFAVKGKLKKAIHQFDISKGGSGFVSGEEYTIHPPAPTDRRNGREKREYGAHNGKGAKNRILETRAPIRPTRSIMCFVQPKPVT